MRYFGEYVKDARIEKQLTLRDFCRRAEIDPSNWSKIERGILQPPKSKEVLGHIAAILGIAEGTEAWFTLHDLAVVAHVPIEIIDDNALISSLPVFFRTLRGQKPSRKELEELIEVIRKS